MTTRSPKFWAKTTPDGAPGCSVREHCLATAEVARLLIERFPAHLRQQLPDGLLSIVALHDVGKISPGFQTKCAQWKGPFGDTSDAILKQWSSSYEKAHAATSEWILGAFLSKNSPKERPWKSWAACVGAHHGTYQRNKHLFPFKRNQAHFLPHEWLDYTHTFISDITQQVGSLPELPLPKENTSLQEWIIGLIEVADWIASNEDYFPADDRLSDTQIPERARYALNHIGFTQEPCVQPGKSWADLFPHAPVPRPIQQHLWNLPAQPGTYIVEDAMGGGKTEAALGLAYHLMEAGVANGLYFALPTQTTSNRLFERVLDFLQRADADVTEQSIRLAHSNSWLVQEDIFKGWQRTWQHDSGKDKQSPTDSGNYWFASSRRALLTRFGVGTIDQALMGEIAVKHSFVRRFGLAGKVVILDEVHSYDIYTGSLLDNMVRNLRALGASVIILSATLTKPRLQALLNLREEEGNFCDYPLITTQAEQQPHQEVPLPGSQERSIRVHCRHQTEEETVQLACEHAERGQCVLWIRNTVEEAQRAYRLLCAERREGGPELGLLHARFPLWRRQELENEWITRLGRDDSKRPKGCVLISTQVAEQSLDIDADFLITDLAPTDMLLQRAGRLWRHERPLSQRHAEEAEMLILTPQLPKQDDGEQWKQALGPSGTVYAPYVLLRSLEVWQTQNRLSLPADIRRLLNSTYEERPESPDSSMETFLKTLQKARDNMQAAALVNMQKDDERAPIPDNDNATTRYLSRPMADILLLRQEPEYLSPLETRYTPLHGAPFTINQLHWDFSAARALQETLVRIPRSMAKELDTQPGSPCISGYGLSPIYPLIPLDTLSPCCYNNNVSWTLELGVYPSQRVPNINSYDEEE